MDGATFTRRCALGLTIAASAIAAPTAQSYPVDPVSADRLEVPTTSRTSQGIRRPTKQTGGKQRSKARPMAALAPRSGRAS